MPTADHQDHHADAFHHEHDDLDHVHDTSGETLAPVARDTLSGEADYVATSPGGSGVERHVPTADEEQGRGTEYDPVTQGPEQEG